MTGYLLPGPPLPLSVSAGDGTVSFDGERVRLEWNWKTEDAKAAAGPRTLAVADLEGVDWQPAAGLENGHLRFLVRHAPTKVPAKYDPNAVELWGFKKDPLMALVAAAVQARLPHPSTPAAPALAARAPWRARAPPGPSGPRRPAPPRTTTTRCCAGCGSWASCTGPGSSPTRSSPSPNRPS